MCGRYTLYSPVKTLAEVFGFTARPNLRPRYNIAPTEAILSVRAGAQGSEAFFPHWGLIPPWVRDPSGAKPLINARGETVAEKPSFREAFHRRRCLIPANGFYEWKHGRSDARPRYVSLDGDAPFVFAGLWTEGGEVSCAPSCAIVTTQAHPMLASVHPRMPVMLGPEGHDAWLRGPVDEAQELIKPWDGPRSLTLDVVSTRANKIDQDDADLLCPVEEGEDPGDSSAPDSPQGVLF